MKRHFFFLLLTLALAAEAQPWQWAIKGGCVNAMQVSQDYNNITHITTDQAGNVYTLGPVGSFGLKVDGRPLTAYSGFSPGASPDILLTSFTASGQYRWAKVFGGYHSDYGHSLKSDSIGNIYIGGLVRRPSSGSSRSINFDTDSIVPWSYKGDSLKQIMFLVKYDTAGNFQWLRMPEPDTVSKAPQLKYNSFPYRIETESNGTVHWFCHLKPGKFNWANSNIIAQEGDYILKYNPQGEMTDRVLLDMETSGFGFFIDGNAHFARNPQNGNYYIAGTHEGGYGPLLIGGDTIKDRMYLAAFDATGQVLWKIEGTNDINTDPLHLNNRINAMALDDNGDIYLTGNANTGAQFGGFKMSYPLPNASLGPFVLRFGSGGNLLWSTNAHPTTISPSDALVVTKDEVAIAGAYGLDLFWPGSTDTVRGERNGGNDAYLARFDKATGELATMERTRSPFGVGSYGHSIAAGPANTYYLGGNFDAQLYLGNDTLTSGGSQRSFFLARYSCDVPGASFSFSGTNAANRLSLAYTGAPADSVVWHLGDGTVLTGDSIQHPYAAKGRYRVCATAYFPCTEVTACDSLDAGSIGVAELEGLSSVEVYPNPTTGKLFIENAGQGSRLAVYNLSGQKLLSSNLKGGTAWIDLWGLPVGIYLLQLSDSKGAVIHKKLIKE